MCLWCVGILHTKESNEEPKQVPNTATLRPTLIVTDGYQHALLNCVYIQDHSRDKDATSWTGMWTQRTNNNSLALRQPSQAHRSQSRTSQQDKEHPINPHVNLFSLPSKTHDDGRRQNINFFSTTSEVQQECQPAFDTCSTAS